MKENFVPDSFEMETSSNDNIEDQWINQISPR